MPRSSIRQKALRNFEKLLELAILVLMMCADLPRPANSPDLFQERKPLKLFLIPFHSIFVTLIYHQLQSLVAFKYMNCGQKILDGITF